MQSSVVSKILRRNEMRTIKTCVSAITLLAALAVTVMAGDWADTKHAVVLGGKLYTIETSGALYVTELPSGKWTQLGKAEFANTKFFFAGTTNLFTIEADGSLYRVSAADGSWVRVGKTGDWKNTMVGAMIGDKLYTVESEGALYETNTTSGAWRQIGKADFVRTKFFYSSGDRLYSIEGDGNFYSISPVTGAWQRIGTSNDWVNTNRSTMHNGKLYSTEGGALFETDPLSGAWKKISTEYIRVAFLFGAGSSLYYIEFNGNLYRINPIDGSVAQIGK